MQCSEFRAYLLHKGVVRSVVKGAAKGVRKTLHLAVTKGAREGVKSECGRGSRRDTPLMHNLLSGSR